MKFFQRLSVRTFIVTLVITLIFSVFIVQNNMRKTTALANFYKNGIEANIALLMQAAQAPESFIISNADNFTQTVFDDIATYMHKQKSFIFMSFTPKQSVTYVYPKEEFNHIIGSNGFFKPEEARLSQISLSSNETLLYINYDPTSQDRWLFIKNPIIKEAKDKTETFLGFITIAYSVNEVITKFQFDSLLKMGYEYQLQLLEENQPYSITKSSDFSDIFAIKNTITTGGSTWEFSLSPSFMILFDPLLLILIFFSLRCVYYIYVHIRQRKLSLKKQIHYELYVDSLTGVYNRKKLETLLTDNTKASVIYISLQGYENVKKDYGQSYEDGLLIAYSKRVKYNVKGGMVIHLGLEEFVVFLEGEISEDAIQAVIKRITDLSLQPFSIMGKVIQISARVGYSSIPKDSTKFTSLLNIAMERAKK